MKRSDIRGHCPNCFGRIKAALDPVGDEAPVHGDVAVCELCGEFLMFDFTRRKNLYRRPTVRECFDLERNASAVATRRRWHDRRMQ